MAKEAGVSTGTLAKVERIKLGRRNLSEFSRSELVLKRKPIVEAIARARQAEAGGDRKSETALLGQESLRQNSDEAISGKNDRRTDDQLAKEAKTSRDTIRKTEKVLANAIEAVKQAARDENDPELRKPFTPSESVAVAKVIGPIQTEAAAKRMKAGKAADTDPRKNFPRVGKAADAVAEAVGMSAPTLAKATAVVDAAAAHPAVYGASGSSLVTCTFEPSAKSNSYLPLSVVLTPIVPSALNSRCPGNSCLSWAFPVTMNVWYTSIWCSLPVASSATIVFTSRMNRLLMMSGWVVLTSTGLPGHS